MNEICLSFSFFNECRNSLCRKLFFLQTSQSEVFIDKTVFIEKFIVLKKKKVLSSEFINRNTFPGLLGCGFFSFSSK